MSPAAPGVKPFIRLFPKCEEDQTGGVGGYPTINFIGAECIFKQPRRGPIPISHGVHSRGSGMTNGIFLLKPGNAGRKGVS